jgi:predicted NBD/HSP70 family sugar kinase
MPTLDIVGRGMTDAGELLNLRQMNRLKVIEALYRHPPSSRMEVVRRSKLSRPTVTTLLDELERAGVVEPAEPAPEDDRPTTGRPPALVSLVPRAAFAVGLDFGHQHIRALVCDLSGEVLADGWSPADVDGAPTDSLDLAHDLVQGALRDSGVTLGHVLGVGMGLAAPIDRLTGDVYAEGIMPGWSGVQPRAEMERRLGLRVRVENDANVGALGEHVYGAGRGVEDLAYVRLSAGVGLGLILAGRPYRGLRGVAGEIGHVTTVREGGQICRCGNRGCLETVASPVAVAELLARSRGEPVPVARLIELVSEGDRGAMRAVADAGGAVGEALAMVVNVLNPELIVVGGDLAVAGEVLLDPFRAAIERHAVSAAAASVRVVAGELGARAEALGAAALVLAQSPLALAQRVAQVS